MTDYEWLTEHGFCHKCGKQKAAPHRKFCFDCLDKIREINAKTYDPVKAHEYQERRRELYQEHKENGICIRCSKPATHGLYCYEHFIKAKSHNMETAERRKRERHERGLIPDIRKREGLCLRCGQPVLSDKLYCKNCYEDLLKSQKVASLKSPWRENEKRTV